jgi:hypothetical protein
MEDVHPEIKQYFENQGLKIEKRISTHYYDEETQYWDVWYKWYNIPWAIAWTTLKNGGPMIYRLTLSAYAPVLSEQEVLKMVRLKAFW